MMKLNARQIIYAPDFVFFPMNEAVSRNVFLCFLIPSLKNIMMFYILPLAENPYVKYAYTFFT